MQNMDQSNISGLNNNSTDQFTELLNSILTNNSNIDEQLAATLGSHASLANISSNTSSSLASNANNSVTNYLSAFLLNGVASNTGNTLTQYNNDYTNQQKYDNFLEGAEQYADSISKAATTYNVPEKLLASIIKQESNFNSNAVSSAGATGLMQLMPSTAKYLGVKDATDPDQNIMGGAKYLRKMLDQFDNNLSLALAAYNAGPGNVKKYDGIPPFKETQKYVAKVMNYYQT
jgi:soluble lytic murein transglycosylase-like protein